MTESDTPHGQSSPERSDEQLQHEALVLLGDALAQVRRMVGQRRDVDLAIDLAIQLLKRDAARCKTGRTADRARGVRLY